MKDRAPLIYLLFFVSLVFASLNGFSQCQELSELEVINPGFEGPLGAHITPSPWSTCGITPDTQPGSWGVTLPPSEGSSYVGFVYGGPNWQEGASQQLSGNMEAGVTYDFTIDLSATPASGGGINPNSFCSMEVWGANAICSQQEFLWSSVVVTHYGWQTYNVSITPSQNFAYLYFICNCGDLGYILLDNITPLQADDPNVEITSHADGDAEACSFTLAGTITDAIIDSVVLTGNFAESPLTTTIAGLTWSGNISFNGSGNEAIQATAYYTDTQFNQDVCVMAEINLVISSPTSAFNFTDQCDGVAISFNDASVPFGANTVTDWDWDFGDSNSSTQQSPIHVYAGPGTYTVTLDIETSDGCSVSSSQDINIFENPVADFSFNEACEGDVTNFTDGTTITNGNIQTWQWVFDDGNNSALQDPTNTYANLGTYDVQLTVTTDNNCTDVITQTVGMYPLPVADFSFTDACLNTNFQFNDLSSVSSGSVDGWQWTFDDGNTSFVQDPTNLYAADGTYNVSLNVVTDHQCLASATQVLTVYPLPVSDFTSDVVCTDLATQFADNSSVTSGAIITYEWYFGDGNLSALQNPTHPYLPGGTYTASLVVTTALGCEDSTAIDVIVLPKPVAEFNSLPACLNEANVFSDQSTIVGSTITGWDWEFGDNTGTDLVQNPSYTYGSSGQFAVTLIAITADGCRDTISHNTDVFDLPVADFSFSDICEDDSVQFSDLSTIPSGNINGWNWDFGNDSISAAQIPPLQHYPADAIYTVSLIVSSGLGCADTAENTIEIWPVPIAAFSFDSVCFPLEIQFTDLSDPNGTYPINSWTWEFSDMQGSTDQSPSMDFGMPGTYSANLLIANSVGCKSAIDFGDAVVHPLPVPDFPMGLATCIENIIFFSDSSSITPITDDVIVAWNWDFDDGNVSIIPEPSHLYTAPALYNVDLNVVTNHGCEETITRMVEIYPRPVIDIAVAPGQEGCAPFFVQFDDQSSISNPYSLATWQWSLGAGLDSSFISGPSLTYNPDLEPMDVAVFDVYLQVTSLKGCESDSLFSEYITVHPKPIADFEVDQEVRTFIDPEFEFTDLSTINVTSWDWNFGDDQYSSTQNPSHTYLHIGEFPITLIVETDFGCKDTTGIIVEVDPVFTFWIPNSFTPNEDGINDSFIGVGESYTYFSMEIYDRWGELVYQTKNDEEPWDGTYKGLQAQQATYVYYFHLIDWQKNDHKYHGHVTLNR